MIKNSATGNSPAVAPCCLKPRELSMLLKMSVDDEVTDEIVPVGDVLDEVELLVMDELDVEGDVTVEVVLAKVVEETLELVS
jgi:hypothetical protein